MPACTGRRRSVSASRSSPSQSQASRESRLQRAKSPPTSQRSAAAAVDAAPPSARQTRRSRSCGSSTCTRHGEQLPFTVKGSLRPSGATRLWSAWRSCSPHLAQQETGPPSAPVAPQSSPSTAMLASGTGTPQQPETSDTSTSGAGSLASSTTRPVPCAWSAARAAGRAGRQPRHCRSSTTCRGSGRPRTRPFASGVNTAPPSHLSRPQNGAKPSPSHRLGTTRGEEQRTTSSFSASACQSCTTVSATKAARAPSPVLVTRSSCSWTSMSSGCHARRRTPRSIGT
mmetsp:Transcript_60717/g.188253  ORF Transcript_60717/g.188253 Transcript_60717/m.188253 type:complete len:285 (+) Transcript_60717:983-1837(+)